MRPVKNRSDLSVIERVFLKVWCLPPPPVPFEPRDSLDTTKPPPLSDDPLGRVRRVFGAEFEMAIRNRVFLDIGCGLGEQVIGAALFGASLAVGVDKNEINIRFGQSLAEQCSVASIVRLTTDPVSSFGRGWADVALSQNSFEHFDDPALILRQAYEALRPGGRFFVTFGPSWWHPYGVHHMFMIRMPWAHLLFSESTILRVRQLYRPNRPTSWREVALNQMTIRKLLQLANASGFALTDLSVTPIGPLPRWLVRTRLFREWTTSDVSVILTKPDR